MTDFSRKTNGNTTSQNSPSGWEIKNFSARSFPYAICHESKSLPKTLTCLHFQDSPWGNHIHIAWEVGLLVGTSQQLSMPDWASQHLCMATEQSCSIMCLSSSRGGPGEWSKRHVVQAWGWGSQVDISGPRGNCCRQSKAVASLPHRAGVRSQWACIPKDLCSFPLWGMPGVSWRG